MSVQSLNGDSYQGAQVGANVQSQVGTQPMCRQVNALESKSRQSDRHFLLLSRQKETERCRDKTLPTTKPKQRQPLSWGILSTLCECIWLWLVSRTRKAGEEQAQGEVTEASGPRVFLAHRREREEFRLSACFPGLFLVCWFFHTQRLPNMEVIND